MKCYGSRMPSPLGELLVLVDENGAVLEISFVEDEAGFERRRAELAGRGREVVLDPRRCAAATEQLAEYFAGRRQDFDLPLAPAGTEFQRAVWEELRRIPYGETISYRELAERVGNPRASRAVGRANATNPVAIAIPCHRVIASDGGLTGYAFGVERKRALLDLERAEE